MSQSAIQAIDRAAVHQICSGQVIVDLRTAVKELVENALVRRAGEVVAGVLIRTRHAPQDAGATQIEVRLKEYGLSSFEVSDNGEICCPGSICARKAALMFLLAGSGVAPENYEALTKKHFTSKLRDFSELDSVASFGFRCDRVNIRVLLGPRSAPSHPLARHRGEALSSVCELASSFSVATRMASQPVGTRMAFARDGSLVEQVRRVGYP